jgi:hypothetical protein
VPRAALSRVRNWSDTDGIGGGGGMTFFDETQHATTGAAFGFGEKSPERLAQRNGYLERERETPAPARSNCASPSRGSAPA